jgi:antitoxin VapB
MDTRSRHVRLFKNGRNQAVRIPREMELPGDQAVIYRDGQRLIIEPTQRPSLSRLLATWDPVDSDWPDTDDPRSARTRRDATGDRRRRAGIYQRCGCQ